MRLLAISDVHVRHEANRRALATLPDHGDDWLIVAGDIGDSEDDLRHAWQCLRPRFAKIIWAPGNHELWTLVRGPKERRGNDKSMDLVRVCREFDVATPEDPYLTWPGPPGPHKIAPLFLLYDYTYRPVSVRAENAVEWAADSGVICSDEYYLHPDPYPSREAWCRTRCADAARRLEEEAADLPTVLINHWPLRQEFAFLPLIPRFSIWCGTTATEDWHRRFRARVVVCGHLHIRQTVYRDGVRFEEVSLGYPKQYREQRGLDAYLREILPGPAIAPLSTDPQYHR